MIYCTKVASKDQGRAPFFSTCAELDTTIQQVQTTGLLASYYSSRGYGTGFNYAGGGIPASGGYGSLVPCIPNILSYADVAQLVALCAPNQVFITDPKWGSGDICTQAEANSFFA